MSSIIGEQRNARELLLSFKKQNKINWHLRPFESTVIVKKK
jgi:hypothetical protein